MNQVWINIHKDWVNRRKCTLEFYVSYLLNMNLEHYEYTEEEVRELAPLVFEKESKEAIEKAIEEAMYERLLNELDK